MFFKKKKTLIIDGKSIEARLTKIERDIEIILNMSNVNAILNKKEKDEIMTNQQMMKEWLYGEERAK